MRPGSRVGTVLFTHSTLLALCLEVIQVGEGPVTHGPGERLPFLGRPSPF